jgi:hypothetical protein
MAVAAPTTQWDRNRAGHTRRSINSRSPTRDMNRYTASAGSTAASAARCNCVAMLQIQISHERQIRPCLAEFGNLRCGCLRPLTVAAAVCAANAHGQSVHVDGFAQRGMNSIGYGIRRRSGLAAADRARNWCTAG